MESDPCLSKHRMRPQRRVSVRVAARRGGARQVHPVDIGALLQQVLNRVQVPVVRRANKRCILHLRPSPHAFLFPCRPQQPALPRRHAVSGRGREGAHRASLLNVSALLDHQFNNDQVACRRRAVML